MANWNEIRTKITDTANKAAKRTGEIADTASKHVKVKMIDAKLSSRYEELGRLTYKQLKTEISQAEKISSVIEAIDKLREDRRDMVEQIEADKQRRAERKKDSAEQSESTEEAASDCNTEE